MTDVVGRGAIELEADTSKLEADLARATSKVKQSGQAAESAFGKQAAGGIAKAEGRLQSLTGKLDRMAKGGGVGGALLGGVGLAGGLAVFSLVQRGLGAVIDGIGTVIKMAAEEEAAIAQLTQAIRENDAAWDGNSESVEELITARQKLAFSDGEQRESLRTLVSVTKDLSDAEDVLGIAMDLARLKNISLASASDLLGKVYAGNLGTLSRYGIVLEKGATATEALAEIQRRASGQAAKYAATTQGKLVRSQIAMDDAMEDLGKTLTPLVGEIAGLAASGIPLLTSAVGDALAPLRDLDDVLDDIADEIKRIEDETGIDFANHIANGFRIAITGGTILAVDALPHVQRGLQDVGEEVGILNEDMRDLGAGMSRTRRSMQALTEAERELSEEELAALLAEQEAAAKALASAITLVANEAFPDIKDAAKEAQEAIRKAFNTDSVAALQQEEAKLQRQLRRALREREWDAAAAIQARLDDVQGSIRQRETNAEHFKAERREMKARQKLINEVADEHGVSSKRVTNLLRRNKGDMEAVRKKLGEVKTGAEEVGEVDPSIKVTTPGAGAALTRLQKLAAEAAAIQAIGAVNVVVNAVGGLFGNKPSRGTTPRQDEKDHDGNPFVQQTGWRYLERGERVLSKEANRALQPGRAFVPMLDSRKVNAALSGQAGGGGNTYNTVHVHMDGAFLGRPLDAQRFAQEMAPVLGRELKRISD